MPVYLYKCSVCSEQFEIVCKVKDHVNPAICDCGNEASQVITRPMLITVPDIYYQSPVDGTPITNKRARDEDLARNNCMEYDPGMKQDADRRVFEADQQLDKHVDDTVDRAMEQMPTKQRERLVSELSAGLTAEPVRL